MGSNNIVVMSVEEGGRKSSLRVGRPFAFRCQLLLRRTFTQDDGSVG